MASLSLHRFWGHPEWSRSDERGSLVIRHIHAMLPKIGGKTQLPSHPVFANFPPMQRAHSGNADCSEYADDEDWESRLFFDESGPAYWARLRSAAEFPAQRDVRMFAERM
jgi:hypothetical protein